MDYEVILSYPAKAQLDHAINYILCEFESLDLVSSAS